MTKKEVMQQSKNEKKNFDVAADLTINKYRLDDECISHSGIYFNYCDAMVQAKSTMTRKDDALKIITAERNIAIRKEKTLAGEKFTESVIAAELELDKKILQAREELREAQEIYARFQVVVQAMDARRSELDNLVKLFLAGYYSAPAGEAKSSINEQTSKDLRKKLNKE